MIQFIPHREHSAVLLERLTSEFCAVENSPFILRIMKVDMSTFCEQNAEAVCHSFRALIMVNPLRFTKQCTAPCIYSFKYEAQTALFKDPVRKAQ